MALRQFASRLLSSGKASLYLTPMLRQLPVSFSVKPFSSGIGSEGTRPPNCIPEKLNVGFCMCRKIDCENLIEEIRRFPVLYDQSKEKYRNAEYKERVWKIVSTNVRVEGPKVQAPAPHFEGTAVVGQDFKTIKLNDFSGKYLYLFFYPMDFTFVCPTEIIAFSDKMEEFDKLNTAVVGCSCDSQFSHLAWTQTPRKKGGLGELKYPLLADFKKIVARDYNVLLENEGVPLRGSFLIDPKGVIRQITINDLPVGRSIEEVLRLVKAFQFVDSHGEVCPANWDPEKKSATIKPDPKGSKDYFEKVN